MRSACTLDHQLAPPRNICIVIITRAGMKAPFLVGSPFPHTSWTCLLLRPIYCRLWSEILAMIPSILHIYRRKRRMNI